MLGALPRDLRTSERFILGPPVEATFDRFPVEVSDISSKGARMRHDTPMEAGARSMLKIDVERLNDPVFFESVIVWTQSESQYSPRYSSGVRIYGKPGAMDRVLSALRETGRSNRIEELRASDRFRLNPRLPGIFGPAGPVRITDLSACGAKVELNETVDVGTRGPLSFEIDGASTPFELEAVLVWTRSKTLYEGAQARYVAGLRVDEKREHLRLAIAHLCELRRATIDTHSLNLKLKIMRARARHQSSEVPPVVAGVSAEEMVLIEGVRAELRANPEEAAYWRTRGSFERTMELHEKSAEEILAVWEYLDRSIDLTVISRCFARGEH